MCIYTICTSCSTSSTLILYFSLYKIYIIECRDCIYAMICNRDSPYSFTQTKCSKQQKRQLAYYVRCILCMKILMHVYVVYLKQITIEYEQIHLPSLKHSLNPWRLKTSSCCTVGNDLKDTGTLLVLLIKGLSLVISKLRAPVMPQNLWTRKQVSTVYIAMKQYLPMSSCVSHKVNLKVTITISLWTQMITVHQVHVPCPVACKLIPTFHGTNQ